MFCLTKFNWHKTLQLLWLYIDFNLRDCFCLEWVLFRLFFSSHMAYKSTIWPYNKTQKSIHSIIVVVVIEMMVKKKEQNSVVLLCHHLHQCISVILLCHHLHHLHHLPPFRPTQTHITKYMEKSYVPRCYHNYN